jgi:hypothetical protein
MMKIYTLQIGTGINSKMSRLEHSETLSAETLRQAVATARETIRAKSWGPQSNLVQLVEELGDDSRVMWFRPIEAVIGL